MKTIRPLMFPAALALAVFAAGCATAPLPKVQYPVTYQINIGNTAVTSNYGPQNLSVNATQQVAAAPGEPLYYQVNSPVNVNLYVYEDETDGSKRLLGQLQGTAFTSSVTPSTSVLEFAFAVTQANSGGTLQFTLSDQPIAPAVAPPPPPP